MKWRRDMSLRAGARSMILTSVALATLAACTPPPQLVDLPVIDKLVVAPAEPVMIGPLRMRGSDLVDAAGRVVLIHGMNSVDKSPPYISPFEPGWLGVDELAYLRNSGFNGIRLGVSYAAMMPDPGRIDEDYLDEVVRTVDRLATEGLWVQLDFHQDVFHQMPAWASPEDAAQLSDDPPSLLSFIGWAARYMSPRSLRQWDSFLAGEPIVGGRSVASVLGDAAGALAARVADRDNVIGIEMLNEPFPGTPILDCIFSGCPDRERLLSDRYAEMGAPVRAAAPDMALWFEPFAPTGYLALPVLPAPEIAPTPDGAQLGLAWHLYCKDTDGGHPQPSDEATTTLCDLRFRQGFEAGAQLAAGFGRASGSDVAAPRILNEFGASQDPLDVSLVSRLADDSFVSWIYWHGPKALSATDSDLPDVVESQIIRPYPQATAGTPGTLRYEPSTGRFDYTFTPDETITAPTSIVVPTRAYPDGYTASTHNGRITSQADAGRLIVVGDGTGAPVTVTISR